VLRSASHVVTGQEAMLSEIRRLLDRVAARVGWKWGEIRHPRWRPGSAPRSRLLPLGYVRASQARASALPNSLPATWIVSPVVKFVTTCPMTPDPVERPVVATIRFPALSK